MTSFTTTTGQHTFRHTSAKVWGLVYKPGAERSTYLKNAFDENYASRSNLPGSRDGDSRTGRWYTSQFTSVDDVMVGFFMSCTMNGAPYGSVGQIVKLRSDGPLIAINFTVPTAAEATMKEIVAFMGHGDLIDNSEFLRLERAGEYPALPYRFIRTYRDPEELADHMVINILSQGKPEAKKEKLRVRNRKTGAVETVAVADSNRRRIRIRR